MPALAYHMHSPKETRLIISLAGARQLVCSVEKLIMREAKKQGVKEVPTSWNDDKKIPKTSSSLNVNGWLGI